MLSIVKYIASKYMYCKVVYSACLIKIVKKKIIIIIIIIIIKLKSELERDSTARGMKCMTCAVNRCSHLESASDGLIFTSDTRGLPRYVTIMLFRSGRFLEGIKVLRRYELWPISSG